MKVHCCNILLFSLILNTLLLSSSQVNVHRKHYSIALHTSKTPKLIKSNRSLCECDIYKPNYDDPEMKNLMENFNKQTQQRFHEYDEHINDKRQKCKEQREKDIKNIILKDKIEKELTEKLSALQTDIQSDAIPTCVCEKSVTDKFEKTCLKCGKNLGGFVPGFGLIGGTAVYAAAVNAATKIGMKAALEGLEYVNGLKSLLKENIKYLVTTTNFKCPYELVAVVQNVKNTKCVGNAATSQLFCRGLEAPYASTIIQKAAEAGREGTEAYIKTFSDSTTITTFLTHPILISAIVVISIVVILLIIYLILRYRRKIKMNKKLQYIKLLKE
ncbi:hypothetical protein PFAG_02233 [Plasmodium falciparum Santa Lucia]|uniref:Rifin n=2 Tax=Plasmodium falciparum TaxID=5833 RepID=A0A0L7KKS6_PLAFX|nr:hypothetical protein PFAG_02233 [Plasmodium falciparum Santa Lucia]KOB63968.1 hypothetical protein PFHG_05349 [Plasmodium falciparum HB3]